MSKYELKILSKKISLRTIMLFVFEKFINKNIIYSYISIYFVLEFYIIPVWTI